MIPYATDCRLFFCETLAFTIFTVQTCIAVWGQRCPTGATSTTYKKCLIINDFSQLVELLTMSQEADIFLSYFNFIR